MKILENLLLDDEEIETSKFRWIIQDKDLCLLEEIDLDTMKSKCNKISTPLKEHIYWSKCGCSLPGNRTFCYRCDYSRGKNKGIVFIIDENHQIQFLPSNISTVGNSPIFYDNFVYMYGEESLFRYNLVKRRWEKLAKNPWKGYYYNYISLNGKILVSWYGSKSAFVFDLWSFSYSACPIELDEGSTKILCNSKNVAYIIDLAGIIWESDKSNLYKWSILGSCRSVFNALDTQKVFYKNSWYFNWWSNIMEFNLDEKTIKNTNQKIAY